MWERERRVSDDGSQSDIEKKNRQRGSVRSEICLVSEEFIAREMVWRDFVLKADGLFHE